MLHKIKDFKQLIGQFNSPNEEQVYKVVEKKFELKRKYTERDWLT